MNDPYKWPFPQRYDTMYMSMIGTKDKFQPSQSGKFIRNSSFQKNDIEMASPRRNIPQIVTRANFSLSSQVEPRPQLYRLINKTSNPLKIDDIEGARPQAVQFQTKRSIDPNAPRYKLPSAPKPSIDNGRDFIRNTLDISDIKTKQMKYKYFNKPQKGEIEGSKPTKLFRTIEAVSRMEVKDINEDRIFRSKRIKQPIDPLEPTYTWRDKDHKSVNSFYGHIQSSAPKKIIPLNSTKIDRSLNATDIEGAHVNSYNQKNFLLNNKRTQFRDYMKIDDIAKTQASSLKKGIQRSTAINPLMPDYSKFTK